MVSIGEDTGLGKRAEPIVGVLEGGGIHLQLLCQIVDEDDGGLSRDQCHVREMASAGADPCQKLESIEAGFSEIDPSAQRCAQ